MNATQEQILVEAEDAARQNGRDFFTTIPVAERLGAGAFAVGMKESIKLGVALGLKPATITRFLRELANQGEQSIEILNRIKAAA